ncbi:dTDP-4-dehydrorhamnose reductase [Akkermansiaceae bacterium]|nr:dTDP-4-dehydrorhamnose reductase [Akkermansiaceae bacterium]
MRTLLVTGASGQLGSELRMLASIDKTYDFLFKDSSDLDITDERCLKILINSRKIDAIINCAAYTAVDKAESDKDRANAVNHLAVLNLGKIAKDYAIQLIHISSDYVFDGKNYKPYDENDDPNPQTVYGRTKLNGELALRKINPPRSAIIRTSWLHSVFNTNFVKTILALGKTRDELKIVGDQIGSPTHAKDLAEVILNILPNLTGNTTDVFHFSNEGICSWYDLAAAIFEFKKIQCKLEPISSSQYPTAAPRPHYSVLSTNKIKTELNIEILHWRQALCEVLTRLK